MDSKKYLRTYLHCKEEYCHFRPVIFNFSSKKKKKKLMNLTNIIFQLSLFPETTFKRRPAYLHPTSLSDENLLKLCCRYNTPGLFIKFSTSNGLIHLPSNPPLPPKFFPIKYFRWGEKGFHNSVKKLDNSLTAFITFRAFNPYPAIPLKWGGKKK